MEVLDSTNGKLHDTAQQETTIKSKQNSEAFTSKEKKMLSINSLILLIFIFNTLLYRCLRNYNTTIESPPSRRKNTDT